MKRLFTNISLCFCLLLIMEGCQKTTTGGFVPNTQIDTSWSASDSVPPVTASIDKPVVTDSFDCNDDGYFTIGDSTIIELPDRGCMTIANNPNTIISKSTKIRVDFLLLTSKGDVIRHRIPTTSNGALLKFGAYVNIKLSYKGNPIYWDTATTIQKRLIRIDVRTKDSSISQSMQYFMFQPDTTGKDTFWLPVLNYYLQPTPIYIGNGSPYSPPNGYTIYSNKIGWFGCASLLSSTPQQTTRLNVFLPINFTNKNTVVYAVFKNDKSVVRLKSDYVGKSYGVAGIPINKNITLVTISKINNVYYLGTQDIKATSSNPYSITPNQVDLSTIDKYLNTL